MIGTQQRRPLRAALPRLDGGRPGQSLRQRGDDQLDRRARARRRCILVIGSNTTRGASRSIALRDQEGRSGSGAKLIVVDPRAIELAALRRRSTCSSGRAPTWPLLNGHDARDPRGGAGRRGVHRRAHRGLRRAARRSLARLHAGAGGADHRRARADDDPRRGPHATPRPARGAIFYTMGITQHSHGTDNVLALCEPGAADRATSASPGTGVNPLRGQNNVQGACDMGALPNVYPGYQPVDDAERAREVRRGLGRRRCPRRPGLTVTEAIDAMAAAGRSRRCTWWARTRCSPTPTQTHVEEALREPRLPRRRRTSSSPRRRSSPTSSCRRRASPRRTGRSPTPSGGCSCSARPCPSPGEARADWLDHRRARAAHGRPDWQLRAAARDHGRDRRAHADRTAGITLRAARGRAGCSGRAPDRATPARRSCTSSASPAG